MPRKDGIQVSVWFTPGEWEPFEEVCEKLVEGKFLPENPSKYMMVRYAVLYFTKKMRSALGLEQREESKEAGQGER